MGKHTPGAYLRDETLVYALMDNPETCRGATKKANRFMANVQACGPRSADREEREAVAEIFRQAPAMLKVVEAAKAFRDYEKSLPSTFGGIKHTQFINLRNTLDAALAEAEQK